MRIAAVDQRAAEAGLFPGRNLADARAVIPELLARELEPERIARIFADFADWHSNASPIVSVLDHVAPWGDLVLDITGVAHLFKGEAAMLDQLAARLEVIGYTANAAIASTVGAAWALAHFAPGQIIAPGEEKSALAGLPVAALRLAESETAALTTFGLKQIGKLFARDRRALQARFGSHLLLRLDQALGEIEERVTPRLPPIDHSVERRFPEPLGLIEDVLMTAADLAVTLAHQLEAAGQGARIFHLFIYRVDHRLMTLSVEVGIPTRDASHIGRLFAYRADRLEGDYDPGFGIDMIRLAASSLAPLAPMQGSTLGTEDGTADLSSFFDRLSSRLGAQSVLRTVPVNTHMPEQAVRLLPVLSDVPAPPPMPPVRAMRPLRLLPRPEPVSVIAEVPDAPPSGMVWRRVAYRFAKASGPERIAADWYNQPTRPSGEEALYDPQNHYLEGHDTRDYYVAEDVDGHRFWLFRLGLFGITPEPRWFMHGLFA
jgi:protein ImuB